MEWERLIDDLSAQFDSDLSRTRRADAAELAEGEAATVTLADRIRGARGKTISVSSDDGAVLTGVVRRSGERWVLLCTERAHVLINLDCVSLVFPLGNAAPPAGLVDAKLEMAHLLRRIARSRQRVGIHAGVRSLVGYLAAVRHDHVDFVDESALGARVSIPLRAIFSVTHVEGIV